jgi:hypothetical protein
MASSEEQKRQREREAEERKQAALKAIREAAEKKLAAADAARLRHQQAEAHRKLEEIAKQDRARREREAKERRDNK